ncbi:hypothetical protein C5689_00525 [Methylosinus sporium]|uniref:H repeat-associated protein N-terminal domain-containing protein n=2 Tax=Methylosinus sporium TaxID=428 RepID=A0A2U1SVK8_METSR|nr:hypothetical protein C5689_00525 [Methylosinus sporium]
MRIVPDHRIPGMVTYPLDEILLTALVGVVCGADDWDGVEESRRRGPWIGCGAICRLKTASPPPRPCARSSACSTRFAAWTASVRPLAREVVADRARARLSARSVLGCGARA